MSTPLQAIAAQDATQAGIDSNIFLQQIQQESGFNQFAKSSAGAEGIAQFMPDTARSMGVDPWNVQQSLTGAATLDAKNLKKYNGDYTKMLAAYNAGGGSVDNAVNTYGSDWLNHMPQETQTYVNTILTNAKDPLAPAKKAISDAASGVTNNIVGQAFKPVFDALPSFGIHIALFFGALMLVIVGLWVLTRNPVDDTGNAVNSGLNNTAKKIVGGNK